MIWNKVSVILMVMQSILIFLLCYLTSVASFAVENEYSVLDESQRIQFKELLTYIPQTSMLTLQKGFSKESIPWWVGIVGSTLILYNNDEVILRNWQQEGRNAGIGNEDHTRPYIYYKDLDILRLPTDTGSAMYYLGDGWMHFGIAGGFLYYGHSSNNNRAYNTGMRIVHGMTVSTIFSQILKRFFGRESPYVRSEYLGKWRPFPSIAAYQSKTPQYDAMPSGHIMTATLTFTIINSAYPEYSNYIVPLAVVWISALGFQMVNNGVHWAADYPLGIALGYVVAKATMQLGKDPTDPRSSSESKTSWMLLPQLSPDSTGVTFLYSF